MIKTKTEKVKAHFSDRHNKLIQMLFTDIKSDGIDLLKFSEKGKNIEIKSMILTSMFTLYAKDNDSDIILFIVIDNINQRIKSFYLVNTYEIPLIINKRGMRLSQVKKLSFFKTENKNEIKEIVESLRSNH